MNNNICLFIPHRNDHHSIHTINFVFETKPQIYSSLKSQAVYRIHLVCSGKGNLHISGKIISLKKGDIFFTFPGTPHCIESVDSFTYMYISFLGTKSYEIMDKLKISSQKFHFADCEELFDFWKKGLHAREDLVDLASESILMYSFYFLGNKLLKSDKKSNPREKIAYIIKKYIDDNFSEQKLTLEKISDELSYSPKYISSVFKKSFKIGITEYLNNLRIHNACTLISQGFTNVSDVASHCGYTDPLYFSKVFKQKIGVSPKTYIKSKTFQEI